MKKIGLLSDTHGYWDERYASYFADCDEIWHAGDIGSIDLADRFASLKPFRAVHGNIDSHETRITHPKFLRFKIENIEVMITHIGGYPGKYEPDTRQELRKQAPKLLIAGHSHILKVMFDKQFQCLYINPGAAGKSGFHQVRTLVRFTIDQDQIKELEVIELT